MRESNIDTTTIKVSVSPSQSSTTRNIYTRATDLSEIDGTSLVYFLQEDLSGKYQIYFGNDIIGKGLPDGAVVTVSYLITNGEVANKANDFTSAPTINEKLIDSNDVEYTVSIVELVAAAGGGAERESVDSVKFSAPLQYASQNRIVSYRDYDLYIRNAYPNLDSISVWGGEDEEPPVFGKVFVSLKPKDNYYISESEKENIITNIIKPRAVVSVRTEFRDPEFLYLTVNTTVEYDPAKTILSEQSLKNSIQNAIYFYKNQYLNKFNVRFAISKLQEAIDNVDTNSIIGSEALIRVQKRIEPTLGLVTNYAINFNVPLLQGSSSNRLLSNEFYVNDSFGIERKVFLEEVPKSFTGINSIQILDPGANYTSEPTVTIIGDGFGATAKAIISLGKIQSIEITNTGIDYNRATVVISGGGGTGASALAVIDTKIGKLRTVYYTSAAQRIVVNNNVGEIDYTKGTILLTDINILRTVDADGLLKITSGIQSNIIQSTRNTILTIDDTDTASITVNLVSI